MANVNALVRALPANPVPAATGRTVRAGTHVRPGSLATTQAGRQLDIIDAKWTPVVEKAGVKGLKQFAKSNPAKVIAGATALALSADWAYDELVELASGPDGEVFAQALESASLLRAEVGLGDATPGNDGMIAGKPSADFTNDASRALEALKVLDDASRAARGLPNLLAIAQWFALDPDLQDWALQNRDRF